jgi:hypothetical protein
VYKSARGDCVAASTTMTIRIDAVAEEKFGLLTQGARRSKSCLAQKQSPSMSTANLKSSKESVEVLST